MLELGGKDAMLVLVDADVERTVRGATWAAFANAGQAGGSVERALCVPEVHDRFLAGVIAGARGLRVGDPRRPDVDVGPLVTRELRDDAVAHGATVHCGGPVEVHGLGGAFCAPAVLTGVTAAMRVAREETPGPLLVVEQVVGEDEAIARANHSDLGLGRVDLDR